MDEVEWLSAREDRAWRAVVLLQTRLRTVLARGLQHDSGLSESDYEVMVHLSEAPGRSLRQYELAQRTLWEKSRLSHHLRRMIERGLVAHVECETDSRGTTIVLTDVGWNAIKRAAPGHVALVRQVLIDALTRDQLDALGVIGDRVADAIAAFEEPIVACAEGESVTASM